MLYIISSTLNTVLFGQAPPKPYQNHHLDPISLLMDKSGLLKLNLKNVLALHAFNCTCRHQTRFEPDFDSKI